MRVELDQAIRKLYASPDNNAAIALGLDRFWLIDLENGAMIGEDDAVDPLSARSRRTAGGSPLPARPVTCASSTSRRASGPDRREWVMTDQSCGWTMPDGTTFATGALDNEIVIWDARTGAPLDHAHPGRPADGEMYPTFLADGHTVLIASSGGAVYTMDTRPDQWIEFACEIAGRNLTEDEWHDAFDDRPYRETCPPN